MPDRAARHRVFRAAVCGLALGAVLLSSGCYRKVIRAEGIGARSANPRIESSSIPKNDPVGDFLFGPRQAPTRVRK